MLQPEDRLGVEQVRLAFAAPLVFTTDGQQPMGQRYPVAWVRGEMPPAHLLRDLFQSHAAELRSEERRVGKECRDRWTRYDGKKEVIEKVHLKATEIDLHGLIKI